MKLRAQYTSVDYSLSSQRRTATVQMMEVSHVQPFPVHRALGLYWSVCACVCVCTLQHCTPIYPTPSLHAAFYKAFGSSFNTPWYYE